MTSPAFGKSVVLVVGGMVVAKYGAQIGKQHVYDMPFRGGDAAYAFLVGIAAMALLPGQYGRPLALGSAAAGVSHIGRSYDVL